MIGLLIATKAEAEPLFGMLRAGSREPEDEGQPFSRFWIGNSRVVIAISGMGKIKAFDATKVLLEQYEPSEVINLGIAGALRPGFKIGSIYRITQALDWPDGADQPWSLAPVNLSGVPGL